MVTAKLPHTGQMNTNLQNVDSANCSSQQQTIICPSTLDPNLNTVFVRRKRWLAEVFHDGLGLPFRLPQTIKC